jgi:small-conductance mechanosensitive channel
LVGTGALPAQQAVPASASSLQSLSDGHATVQKALEALQAKEKEVAAARNSKDPAVKPSPEQVTALEQQLKELQRQYADQELALRSIATGTSDLDAAKPKQENEDIKKDVLETFLRPVMDGAKDAMSRQREIQQLREEISDKTILRNKYEQGLQNLKVTEQAAKAAKKDEPLQEYFRKLRQSLEQEKKSVDLQLGNLQTKMAALEAQKKPWTSHFSDLFRKAILKRVANLMMAAFAFIGVMSLFRLLLRLSKSHLGVGKLSDRPFLWRAFNLFYYVGSITAAVLAALLVLYASDDWFLITLAMFVLAGIALAARHTLPKLYDHAKLLLNLGAVREGERLSHLGLPWLVKRINIYCELENPALEGGEQRLALKQLLTMASRPVANGEKWFPTDVGDWILLPDGTPAKVEHQSPEFVQLALNGGASQVFRTLDFLALNTRNLTDGFRLSSKLQVDFSHARNVGNIADTLKSAVQEGLKAVVLEDQVKALVVELSNIGSSALDVIIQSDFTGQCAPKYFELRREVQQIALATATKNGWVIPFQQLVLHQAK